MIDNYIIIGIYIYIYIYIYVYLILSNNIIRGTSFARFHIIRLYYKLYFLKFSNFKVLNMLA